jgi:hypothetical protein
MGITSYSAQAWVVSVALLPALVGCASVARIPYTRGVQAAASIPGIPQARIWGDGDSDWPSLIDSAAAHERRVTVLALSGGGAEGAYGAGFLKGWSETGTRPVFTIVTGTSVGALIAPFAFLGTSYDARLSMIFSSGEMENLLRLDGLSGLLGSGVFKVAPFKQLIAQYADEAMINAIAAEHRKGRRLFVVTANVDAQRSVIWNMGAIASSNDPHRLDLFRTILLASASIPGIFAPVLIEVEADGKRFAEMHVDGGVISNILAVPEPLLLSKVGRGGGLKPQLFVIVNGKLAPDFIVVDDRTLPIVARSFWTTVKANTRNTLIATYDFTRRNAWEFRATAIEPTRTIETTEINLDPEYVRELFEYGLARGRSGQAWQNRVPDISDTPSK